MLSVNIDALKPPYKVQIKVDNKTIDEVIQSSVPDIQFIKTATAVTSAHKKTNI